MLLALIYTLIATLSAEASQSQLLCHTPTGDVFIDSTSEKAAKELSDVEKRLVCGDPHPEAGNTRDTRFDDAWKGVPLPEAAYNLHNFLADKGYFNSELTQDESGRILLKIGEPTWVTKLVVTGAPNELQPARKRDLLGKRLTPQLLDQAEKWILGRLGAYGYPCPRLTTRANPDTGVIAISVTPGPRQIFGEVTELPVSGTLPGMLRRNDAFQAGDLFDSELLSVTERRITSHNSVESVHLTAQCGPTAAIIHQETVDGAPHLLVLGAGVNTEGVLVGKASWRNVRLGDHASYVDVTAEASTIEQSLSGEFDWYTLPFPSRRSLVPKITFVHDNELYYETLTETPWVGWSTSWDDQWLGLTLDSGPSADFVNTLQGLGPQSSRFLSWRTELELRSHDYELWAGDPRSGFEADLTTRFNGEGFASSATASSFQLTTKGLLNLNGDDPPLVVLGLRASFGTIATGETLGPNIGIPPNLRYFLGGSTDLRGFGRQEAPGPLGALTEAYLGIESRLVATLPFGVEPIAFLDLGKLGGTPWELDAPLYWSPGAGVRWASPIGPIRTTLARGMVDGEYRHWQFFLSLGEEF